MTAKRINNRKANQLRPIKVTKDYIIHPAGSVLIACGNTKVICNASIEENVPHFLKHTGKGWVTAEYSMLPHSTHTRMRREVKKGKESGRTQEISRLIGRSLRSIVDFEKLGERQITIDCDVIQADGGTRCASITGGYIALALAIKKLLAKKIITKNPLTDSVSAISVGIFNGKPILDLNYQEDSHAEVDMNFVVTGRGKFVEVQGTAEEEPFSFDELVAMKNLAIKGVKELTKIQKNALK